LGSLLESGVKRAVAVGFKGTLSQGVIRREVVAALDSLGDPAEATVHTFAFEGIRNSFNLAFAQAAGIPVTDARIVVIAGSLTTVPEQDDKIELRGAWYQVRSVVEVDPADATYTLAAFRIAAP
jgi:hypothetical protein